MREGADFPVTQQPCDLGYRQRLFLQIAFGKRLSQHLKDDRERDALGRQGTSKRSMAHTKAGGDLRCAGVAVRKQLSDLTFDTRTHAGAPRCSADKSFIGVLKEEPIEMRICSNNRQRADR